MAFTLIRKSNPIQENVVNTTATIKNPKGIFLGKDFTKILKGMDCTTLSYDEDSKILALKFWSFSKDKNICYKLTRVSKTNCLVTCSQVITICKNILSKDFDTLKVPCRIDYEQRMAYMYLNALVDAYGSIEEDSE